MAPLSAKSTEIRVGLFILTALAVIVAFILVLANVQFEKGFVFQVDFQSSMTLREGAIVRLSGMKAGKVNEVIYRGAEDATRPEDGGKPYVIRATLELDKELAATIRRDSARFLITTKGMLGETYIEIYPGDDDGPFVAEGDVLLGTQMTAPEEIMTEMSELLGRVSGLMKDQEQSIGDLIESLDELAMRSKDLAKTLQDRAPALLDEVDGAVKDVRALVQRTDDVVASVQDVIGDGEAFHRIVGDVELTASVVAAGAPEVIERVDALVDEGRILVADARTTLEQVEGRVDRLADGADGAVREARGALRDARGIVRSAQPAVDRLPAALDRLETLLTSLDDTVPALRSALGGIPAILSSARRVTDAVADGEGTLGALVMDRALYDDLREMLLDLKRRPWKVIWKE
jgi:phospholipid/cholesterol/gamma-HCH transport system substrate-binding protein